MVILFDQNNLNTNIYTVIFPTDLQQNVGKLLINELKKNKKTMTKTEMSAFATNLHTGIKVDIGGKKETVAYNKRQFYDRILTPMKAMGMIDYDFYKRTYKISDSFNKAMVKIGLLWMKEMR